MTTLVSIVIPIAPYHKSIAKTAVQSALAQTVTGEIMPIHDSDSKGAGWARNRGLELVKTPFVVFLDADDTIHPSFIEKTLRAYEPGHYVYTDWHQGEAINGTDKPWTLDGDWHVITALIPTEAARAIGGFDETVPAVEDTLFYWALTRAGICGIRVPEALFTYGAGGKRAKAFIGTPEHIALMHDLVERYKDMGCCGDNGPAVMAEQSETLKPGFVWAKALWGGNRQQRGTVTGLLYPRTGNGKTLQVAAVDVQAAPHLWREVVSQPTIPTPPKPDVSQFIVQETEAPPEPGMVTIAAEVHGVEAVAAALYPQANTLTVEMPDTPPVKVKPNVEKVTKLAKRGRPKKA